MTAFAPLNHFHACELNPAFEAQNVFDCLLANIYEYQNRNRIFICADFNYRYGDMVDFIEGIGDLGERETIDFNVNKYGHLQIELVLNSIMSVFNGHKYL